MGIKSLLNESFEPVLRSTLRAGGLPALLLRERDWERERERERERDRERERETGERE